MSNVYTNTTEDTIWFIAHNGSEVVHPGTLEPGTHVESGQPYLEVFNSEEVWLARKVELGIIPELEEESEGQVEE